MKSRRCPASVLLVSTAVLTLLLAGQGHTAAQPDSSTSAGTASISEPAPVPGVPLMLKENVGPVTLLGTSRLPQLDTSDLLYSTLLGGSSHDYGGEIAVDRAGYIYLAGVTHSPDFPTTVGAFDTSHSGGSDIFVLKLTPDGVGLVYATFLGGSRDDSVAALALDEAGGVYVAGWTHSPDFPTTPGAFDTHLDGDDSDAFVVKLTPDGTSLDYATLLGGNDYDRGLGLAVDGVGSAYITGYTESLDFPATPGAVDISHNGQKDAFVAKLKADGTGLVFATLLGGSSEESASGISLDEAGGMYVAGHTFSEDFPTTPGAFDTSYNGYTDGFVFKLEPDGAGLAYATLLGGWYWDYCSGIVVDAAGNAYVTSYTESDDFPVTHGAFDTTHNGGRDVFVARLNADGAGLTYATFLGGSDGDTASDISLDEEAGVYLVGSTYSEDFPVTSGAFDTGYSAAGDAFVALVEGGGTELAYASFLGGDAWDGAGAMALDGAGAVIIAGSTQSVDFPTTAGAFDTSFNGRDDAFLARVRVGEVGPTPTPTPGPPLALVNGDFEEGFHLHRGQSMANGWAPYTLVGDPTFAGERSTVHGGSWAYKLAGYAPFTAGLAQVVQVQPGQTYRVTAHYHLYPPGDGSAFLGLQDGTSSAQWVGDSWPGVWRPLSQVVTATSGRLIISLQGVIGLDPNTNVYFDDVSLVPVEKPIPSPSPPWTDPPTHIELFAPVADGIYHSPIEVTGFSQTFEGNVTIRLLDANGGVLAERNAIGGSAGGFDFFHTYLRFTTTKEQPAVLEVFEISPADGSRVTEVLVPITIRSGQRRIDVVWPDVGADLCSAGLSGYSNTFEGAVQVDLRQRDGTLITEGLAKGGAWGVYKDFVTRLDYTVTNPEPLLISAYDAEATGLGWVDLARVPVSLWPRGSSRCP